MSAASGHHIYPKRSPAGGCYPLPGFSRNSIPESRQAFLPRGAGGERPTLLDDILSNIKIPLHVRALIDDLCEEYTSDKFIVYPLRNPEIISKMSTEKKFDNLHTEMFDLGLQNRREVVGDAYVNAALENGKSEFAYPGQQLVTE